MERGATVAEHRAPQRWNAGLATIVIMVRRRMGAENNSVRPRAQCLVAAEQQAGTAP